MSEAKKHTPGPWTHPNITGMSSCTIPVTATTLKAAANNYNGGTVAIVLRQADARLIAAAPDMLETLRTIANDYDCDDDAHRYGTKCRACIANAAIAAAEGRR